MSQRLKFQIKKNIFIKTISIFLIIIVLFGGYLFTEQARAIDDSDVVEVTLTVDSGITISPGDDSIMAPNIGISSNTSIGSSGWTVRTNNVTGYDLSVKADTNPALISAEGKTFEDYTETYDGTPEPWSVSSAKEFGYSAYGDNIDTPTSTWGYALTCGSAGVTDPGQYYVGFKTINHTIATRGVVTPTSGIQTTICFAAEQETVYASSGVYNATITATAATI